VIPTREVCQQCHRESAVGFSVPDDVWKEAVHPHWQNSILCLACFACSADRRLIRWDLAIKFYPVRLRSHLEGVGLILYGEAR
jgi:hypothetical protein